MTNSLKEVLRLGVVSGTHGLRGELKLREEDPDFSVLLEHDELYLQKADNPPVACRIVQRGSVRGTLLVKLAGYDSVEAVAGLVGAAVLVDVATLPVLPRGCHYWYQLRGLRAVDKNEGDLGTLDKVFSTAAHDIYVVNGRFGEVLIPVVAQFITEIDLAAGCIHFDLPEGLVPKTDDL